MSEWGDGPPEIEPDIAIIQARQRGPSVSPGSGELPATAYVGSLNGLGGNLTIQPGTSSAGVTVNVTNGPATISIGVLIPTGLVLLVSTALNLNTNTKQTLYTVPAGKSAIPAIIVARSASVDLSGGVTTFLTFGFNAGATDWNPSTNFPTTDLTAAARFKVFGQESAASAGVSIIGTAGQIFGAITDAAFGSAATVVIDVFGYLF